MKVYIEGINFDANQSRYVNVGEHKFLKSQDGLVLCYEKRNIFGRIVLPVYKYGYWLCEFHQYAEESESFETSEITATLTLVEAEQALADFANKYLKLGQTAQELMGDYFKIYDEEQHINKIKEAEAISKAIEEADYRYKQNQEEIKKQLLSTKRKYTKRIAK